MKFPKRLAIAASILAGLVQVGNAQIFTNNYTADALPTASVPVWQEPLAEANATASVNGGILTIASTAAASNLFYRQTPSEAWIGGASTVEAVLRVDSVLAGGFAQALTVATGPYFATFTFSLTGVSIGQGGLTPMTYNLDTTETHSYWFSASATGEGNLYVDRDPEAVMTFQMGNAGGVNYMEFGVTTQNGAGTVEWDSVSWTNGSAFAPVPEPASYVLVGLAALLIFPLHRRFARRQQQA